MAAQIQLANTFNEFRVAYNDAANDITSLQAGNTVLNSLLSSGAGDQDLYANTAQIKDLNVSGGRVLVSRAPDSGTGAFIDDDDGLFYDTSTNRLTVTGPIDVGSTARAASLTANNLTDTRIPVVGASGLIEDDAGLTYITANNTLITGNALVETDLSISNTINFYANGYMVSANDLNLIGATSRIDAYHGHFLKHVSGGPGDVEDWTTAKGQSDETHHVAAIGDQDSAVDMVCVNESAGINAYAEFIAINDSGDIENGWISMGINSSNYGEGAYAVTKEDDGYILFQPPSATTANGDLVIGTGGNGTGNRIIFSANGFDDPANNTQMIIIPGQQVHIEIDTESTSTITGALRVAGGMGLTGNLNVGGDVTITGAISLLGAGNTVSTDTLSVSNSMLFLANGNSGDVLDIGVIAEYTQGTSKYAGIIRDATDGIVKFFQDASTKPANTVDFTEGGLNYATVKLGELQVSNTTGSTTSTTGALTVGGGAGIAENLYVGGDLDVAGNTDLVGVTGNFTAYGDPTFSGNPTFTGSTTFTGPVRVQELVEDVVDVSSVTNSFTVDYTTGNIFYASSSPSADFQILATNVPTDNGRITTLSLILPQGATGRRPVANTISVNGTNTLINWVGGNTSFAPTNSKTDIFNFTILRRGGAFTVAGTVAANTVL